MRLFHSQVSIRFTLNSPFNNMIENLIIVAFRITEDRLFNN